MVIMRDAGSLEAAVSACLKRIGDLEPRIHAFAHVDSVAALGAARAMTVREGHLLAIPFAVKDVIDVAHLPAEAGSEAYRGRIAQRDAVAVKRLRAAGAIVVGKTHTHELAYGVTTPQTRNPWDLARTAGGSSGGSAAAVAVREVPAALGTDTGGSIRIPASFCGVTGLRPTLGTVPRGGVLDLCWSFDTVGPIARTAAQCGGILRVLAGPRLRPGVESDNGLAGLRIGLPAAWWEATSSAEVLRGVDAVWNELGRLGADLRPVTLPDLRLAMDVGTVIALAEGAAANRGLIGGDSARPSEPIATAIEVGHVVAAVDYISAQRARTGLRRQFAAAFERVDVILTPTTPFVAPGVDVDEVGGEPILAAASRFTLPVSLVGLPALSVPCGLSALGLPIGAQLIGDAGQDLLLCRVGAALQRATDWHLLEPVVPPGGRGDGDGRRPQPG